MNEEGWPTEWLRGVLELAVMRVLVDGDSYGYALTSRLADEGFGVVKGGTLYPLLARLEEGGFVETDWRAGESGPARKYFSLTPAGRANFDAEATRWSAFTRRTHAFILNREES